MARGFNEEEKDYIRKLRRELPNLTILEIGEKFREKHQRTMSIATIGDYCSKANMPFGKHQPILYKDSRLHELYETTKGDYYRMMNRLKCTPPNLEKRLARAGFQIITRGDNI